MDWLRHYIRDVADFPKPGVTFRDIAPLLGTPHAFGAVIEHMASTWEGRIDAITALDARGFIFGGALAHALELPFQPVRKKGKLPGRVFSESYALEYGRGVLELQTDAFEQNMRVLVLDDVLATGGTAHAACSLVRWTGARVAGCAFVIELASFNGRRQIDGHIVTSLVTYP